VQVLKERGIETLIGDTPYIRAAIQRLAILHVCYLYLYPSAFLLMCNMTDSALSAKVLSSPVEPQIQIRTSTKPRFCAAIGILDFKKSETKGIADKRFLVVYNSIQ